MKQDANEGETKYSLQTETTNRPKKKKVRDHNWISTETLHQLMTGVFATGLYRVVTVQWRTIGRTLRPPEWKGQVHRNDQYPYLEGRRGREDKGPEGPLTGRCPGVDPTGSVTQVRHTSNRRRQRHSSAPSAETPRKRSRPRRERRDVKRWTTNDPSWGT